MTCELKAQLFLCAGFTAKRSHAQCHQGVATLALDWVQVGLSARFSVWPNNDKQSLLQIPEEPQNWIFQLMKLLKVTVDRDQYPQRHLKVPVFTNNFTKSEVEY